MFCIKKEFFLKSHFKHFFFFSAFRCFLNENQRQLTPFQVVVAGGFQPPMCVRGSIKYLPPADIPARLAATAPQFFTPKEPQLHSPAAYRDQEIPLAVTTRRLLSCTEEEKILEVWIPQETADTLLKNIAFLPDSLHLIPCNCHVQAVTSSPEQQHPCAPATHFLGIWKEL